MLFPCSAKMPRNQIQSATWATLVSGGHVPPLHTLLFSLSYLSFPFFNPCYFDEATQLGVMMTESHTRCASRGSDRSRASAELARSLSENTCRGRGLLGRVEPSNSPPSSFSVCTWRKFAVHWECTKRSLIAYLRNLTVQVSG